MSNCSSRPTTSLKQNSGRCLLLSARRQIAGSRRNRVPKRTDKGGFDFPIIFLTGHADIPMTVQAMKAGAVEFLTKPCRDQDLLHAVRTALDRDRARRKDQMHIELLRAQSNSLTAREKEVMGFVTAGLLNKQIARGDGYHRGHGEDASRKHHAENAGEIASGSGKDGRPSGYQSYEIESALDLSILYVD